MELGPWICCIKIVESIEMAFGEWKRFFKRNILFLFAFPLDRMQIRLELSHVNVARESRTEAPHKDVYQSRSTSITFTR